MIFLDIIKIQKSIPKASFENLIK